MIYKFGEKVKCENCNKIVDDIDCNVEDFVIPNKIGAESRAQNDDRCQYCGWQFSVERINDTEFEVEECDEDFEDYGDDEF